MEYLVPAVTERGNTVYVEQDSVFTRTREWILDDILQLEGVEVDIDESALRAPYPSTVLRFLISYKTWTESQPLGTAFPETALQQRISRYISENALLIPLN